MRCRWGAGLGLGALFCVYGCVDKEPQISTRSGASISDVKIVSGAGAAQVGMQVVDTDSNGVPVECHPDTNSVSVEVAFNGGAWTKIDKKKITVSCSTKGVSHVNLVLDNSGSQEEVLELTRQSAKELAAQIIGNGGKVGIVRVSTGAKELVPVTADLGRIDEALDTLFVNRGWTSLYDGIRIGHEALGRALTSFEGGDTTLCADIPKPAVVVFSNGVDNNSADQKSSLDSDGMATDYNDLYKLKFKGSQIPIFSMGLGDDVDHDLLTKLAKKTGGKHLVLSGPDALPDAFDLMSQYSTNGMSVCAPLDQVGCGQALVKVQYTNDITYHELYVPCPAAPAKGKKVVMQLALANPGIPLNLAGALAQNAVDWVSPIAEPKILVIRDDNHHGELATDPAYIGGILSSLGYDVENLDEPENGLLPEDLVGYDVVWFSNPGYPVDDQTSMDALLAHTAAGGGVVFNGDDASWAYGNGFDMEPYTHLQHENNGTLICDVVTDDERGGAYRVTFEGEHPVTANLPLGDFLYGDDIDHSVSAAEGAEVLAWGRLDSDESCSVAVPVIVAHDPS